LLAFESKDGPLVVRTNPGHQSYSVERDAAGKLSVSGAQVITSPNGAGIVCPTPTKLSWSDTVVTGESVVEAVEPADREGCQHLRLRPASAAEAPGLPFSVCMGELGLPFVAGDRLRISRNDNATGNARLLRAVRMNGDRAELWLLRGAPGAFGATGWDSKLFTISSLQRAADCHARPGDGCATLEVSDEVVLTFSPRSVQLRGGEGLSLRVPSGEKLEARVVHAVLRPVVDRSCSKDLAAAPVDVGLAVLVRGSSSSAQQIAAPPK